MDTFFAPIGNTMPYYKLAFEGFAGTGKTYTAVLVAIGTHQRIKSKKPVIFFDTENASRFLKPLFTVAGIEVLVKHSRSLSDLEETMRHCREGGSDILLVDSLSHIHENFLTAFRQKKGMKPEARFEFQHWGEIKPLWKQKVDDRIAFDPYNMLICGRAAWEWETEKNPDTGKREIYKAGIKMKGGGETAYEPDVLVLMERIEEVTTDKKRVWREATIIKDRSGLIDGKVFRNPTYPDFAPVLDFLLKDVISAPQGKPGDDTALVAASEREVNYGKEKDAAWEEIEGELNLLAPGSGGKEKEIRLVILKGAFGIVSETAIRGLGIDKLREGLKNVRERVSRGILQREKARNLLVIMGETLSDREIAQTAKKRFGKEGLESLNMEELELLEKEFSRQEEKALPDPANTAFEGDMEKAQGGLFAK